MWDVMLLRVMSNSVLCVSCCNWIHSRYAVIYYIFVDPGILLKCCLQRMCKECWKYSGGEQNVM